MHRKHFPVVTLLALVAVLASCAAHQPAGLPGTPGFWLGVWHGLIAPVSFIVSIFNDSIRIYAFPNAGNWYDFGFVTGMCICGGSGGASRACRKKRSD